MRWHGVFLMLAVAVIVNCALCAPVRRASHDLMDLSLRKLLDSLADTTLPLPSQLSTGREVFLFIRAGAAVLDVRVVAKASMSPEKVAHALVQALEGTEFAGETIEWSQGDEFTVVRLLVERGRFGRRHAQLTVPVGRLVVGLKRAGLVPMPYFGFLSMCMPSLCLSPKRSGFSGFSMPSATPHPIFKSPPAPM